MKLHLCDKPHSSATSWNRLLFIASEDPILDPVLEKAVVFKASPLRAFLGKNVGNLGGATSQAQTKKKVIRVGVGGSSWCIVWQRTMTLARRIGQAHAQPRTPMSTMTTGSACT